MNDRRGYNYWDFFLVPSQRSVKGVQWPTWGRQERVTVDTISNFAHIWSSISTILLYDVNHLVGWFTTFIYNNSILIHTYITGSITLLNTTSITVRNIATHDRNRCTISKLYTELATNQFQSLIKYMFRKTITINIAGNGGSIIFRNRRRFTYRLGFGERTSGAI